MSETPTRFIERYIFTGGYPPTMAYAGIRYKTIVCLKLVDVSAPDEPTPYSWSMPCDRLASAARQFFPEYKWKGSDDG